MDLFDQHLKKIEETQAPLAARMRPRTLDEFVGQDHIIGQGRLLRRANTKLSLHLGMGHYAFTKSAKAQAQL